MLESHVVDSRFEKLHVETGKHGGRNEGHLGVCQASEKSGPDGIYLFLNLKGIKVCTYFMPTQFLEPLENGTKFRLLLTASGPSHLSGMKDRGSGNNSSL